MSNIFDGLRAGSVIVHTDEERGVLWVWHGGCTVCITDATTGQDWDCFNFFEKPKSIDEAVMLCERRAKMLAEEEAEDEVWIDEEYDGQPDEAQEWYDFDPDC